MPACAFEHRDELAFEGLCAQSQGCLFPVAIYKSYLNSDLLAVHQSSCLFFQILRQKEVNFCP